MVFTTLTFALFLIIVFTMYWTLRRQSWRNLLIVIASYIFYGWWDWRFCMLMLGTSLMDFFIGLAMGKAKSQPARRLLLLLSLLGNLGCLGFVKYFNIFAETAQVLAQTLG